MVDVSLHERLAAVSLISLVGHPLGDGDAVHNFLGRNILLPQYLLLLLHVSAELSKVKLLHRCKHKCRQVVTVIAVARRVLGVESITDFNNTEYLDFAIFHGHFFRRCVLFGLFFQGDIKPVSERLHANIGFALLLTQMHFA